MASTSCGNQSLLPMKEPSTPNYNPYPSPLARYEDIVANPKLCIAVLEKLHATMGTKFMIPIIGGRELDLHKLFVEVTSRGGIEKIMREKRWKEVTAIFNFPSTATNASFVLRKYYYSLLSHFEQIYYFKARGWTPTSTGETLESPYAVTTPAGTPAQGEIRPLIDAQPGFVPQPRTAATELPGGKPTGCTSSPVVGVIDGKFDNGYLVTVTVGSETLRGVLYEAAPNTVQQTTPQQLNNNNAHTPLGIQRRRRRKKSEIRRRDPDHPKPNRSGYNFFFAEQHARLKPLHPGKDRDISRMIGELWTKLKDPEKTVYQNKALEDKERYRIEMESYRERLRTGQAGSDVMPLQLRLPAPDVDMVDADLKVEETEGADSVQTLENDGSSNESDSEDDGKNPEHDLDLEASPVIGVGIGSSNIGLETLVAESTLQLLKEKENANDNEIPKVDLENVVNPVENTVKGEEKGDDKK